MPKIVRTITEAELLEIIKEITKEALNEIDGAVYNASQRAKNDSQDGNDTHTVNGKRVKTNDEILSHARSLEPRARESFLKPFVGKRFKFYCENRMGIVCDLIFTLQDMTHLNNGRAILTGEVIFNNIQISGDGIVVDLKSDKIQYKERGSRYKYDLEIDNRCGKQWQAFLDQLHKCIANREKQENRHRYRHRPESKTLASPTRRQVNMSFIMIPENQGKEHVMTEEQLKEALNETVNDVLNRIGAINEMAVPLKTYRARVDGLRFHLVENWCLCKWCQLFNPGCRNYAHWISELKACINNLKFLDIKSGIDKKRILAKMLITDYDYNKANMIERIIRGKFVRENISDDVQKFRVCTEFANNINGLIDAISLEGIASDEYIQNTFKNHTHD